MKIKTKVLDYDTACSLEDKTHIMPQKPSTLFRFLMRFLSKGELKATGFKANYFDMDKLSKDEPCLILMNHSCFLDLKIASYIFRDRPFQIVCTSDGFVGKDWLMRKLGCIPTKKFITDVNLIKDMKYALDTLKTSVLMYPEASYSFDGTQTTLPNSLGKLLKILQVPVVMVRTHGAFLHDPLYNSLQLRKVAVTADVTYLISKEDMKNKKADELLKIIKEAFTFDNFKEQKERGIEVSEPFRADHLNRVLYKCPHCETEGQMEGKGITLRCKACEKSYELTTLGQLKPISHDGRFDHIPDWYAWQRSCVKKELEEGNYQLSIDVSIYMLNNTKAVYQVGDGHLTHTKDGFLLTGCDGKLHYEHKPSASYSLYADYFWYEIGDMICIGDSHALYYCFPKENKDVVAKTRLATEELFSLVSNKRVGERKHD